MARKIKINRHGDVEIHHDDMQHLADGGSVTAPGTTLGGAGTSTVQSSTNPNTGILGTIGGAIGLNNNFQAGAANTQAGTNAAQLNQAYTGVQGAMSQEQALANALQPGGTQAASSQQDLLAALTAEAQGKGPNPAQAALNQNTANNIAQTAALMAGQRGAGTNVGGIARAVGQQGAATQQQAVGQEATMQAQQQLAAQQQEQAQQEAMIAESGQTTNTLNQQQQNEQNILQNANTSFNNAQVGMQENMNNVNAATSAANQNMAGNIFGGILSGASSAVSSIASMFAKGGMVGRDMPDHIRHVASIYHPKRYAEGGEVADDSGEDKSSAPEETTLNSDESAPQPSSYTGGFSPSPSSASNGPGGGASVSLPADQTNFADAMKPSGGSGGGGGGGGMAGIAALAAMAKGGYVKKMAAGGQMDFTGSWNPMASTASAGPGGGSAVNLPAFQNAGWGKSDDKKKPGDTESVGEAQPWELGGELAGGGDNGNPGDQYFSSPTGEDTGEMMTAAKGGWLGMMPGGKIPGKETGNPKQDSYSKDKVKVLASPGEIMLPLHVVHAADPGEAAKKFVEDVIAKHHSKSQSRESNDFQSALKSAILSRKRKA